MLRIIGDSFCDVVAASMESLPKLGGDVLANISLVAGGSGINSAIHGANYCSFRELPIDIELVTAVGNDFQVWQYNHAYWHHRESYRVLFTYLPYDTGGNMYKGIGSRQNQA